MKYLNNEGKRRDFLLEKMTVLTTDKFIVHYITFIYGSENLLLKI